MTKKLADLLVDVLVEAGVRRIYGVGDSLNGILELTGCLRLRAPFVVPMV